MSSKTAFVYDDIFLTHSLGPNHPESPARLQAILKRLQVTGLAQKLLYLEPHKDLNMLQDAILKLHTKIHFDSIVKWEEKALPPLYAVGAVLKAIDAVVTNKAANAFCAVRPPGHHAQNHGAHCDGRYQGEGFCFFNNVAIGARYAQHKHNLKNILVIDWDYHHGNGTENFFYSDPTVFYFSTHAQFDYPLTGFPERIGADKGKGYNLNVCLPVEASDKIFLAAFKEKLFPTLQELNFKPDLILISAGFDSRIGDFLGTFKITDMAFLEVTKLIKKYAQETCKGRIVSVLEGGYNPLGLASAFNAHIHGLLDNKKGISQNQ